MSTVIKVENVSKQYRLGDIGMGTINHDFNRFLHKIRNKEDPYLKIGEENDRMIKGSNDYIWALKDVSFDVKQGEVLGIIGANGAGKSTLLKILSRTTSPTRGSIKIKGRIASLLEVGTGFHPELSGRENIFLNGTILGMPKNEIKYKFDEIVHFAGIERYIDTPVKRYSSGMYVRLAFAVAAHLEPEILIVDEVLAVGDAEFQKKALGKMKNVSEGEGRTVLFVSHNMAAIQRLCSTALFLKNGKVEDIGETRNIIDKYMTIENDLYEKDLEKLNDRVGNQRAIFSSVYIENMTGNIINKVRTGENIRIVIRLKIIDKSIKNLNVGFSFHNVFDEMYSHLYSSFQKFEINPENQDYLTVKFRLKHFPFADRKLYLKGRLLADGIECDWPSFPLCQMEIEDGDFYLNGSIINNTITPFLIRGEWELS